LLGSAAVIVATVALRTAVASAADYPRKLAPWPLAQRSERAGACAIIDFGGFLGVGNRKIAIDWNALHFRTPASEDNRITLDLTRDQVKATPEYREGRPLVVIGTAESLQSYPASEWGN
jgi:hypothetical protein